MAYMKNSSAVRPKGHVRISQAGKSRPVPSVLYRRDGRLYVPSHRLGGRFGRPARDEEVLRGRKVLADGPNHVTKAGRVRVAELIVGISAGFPRRLGVGDGGTSPGTNVPLPPSDVASDLVHEITRIDVTQRIIDVDIPNVTFVGLFQSAGSYQFNQPGQAQISEVGLFTTDDILCAVYNFAPIPVDVHRLGVLVEWEWAVL